MLLSSKMMIHYTVNKWTYSSCAATLLACFMYQNAAF